jgi:hypothetical protein
MFQTAEKKKHVTNSPITVKSLRNSYWVIVLKYVYVSYIIVGVELLIPKFSVRKEARVWLRFQFATPISNNKPLLVAG